MSSKRPNPWRSTTTRIVVSYGLLFGLWALVLVTLIYWQTARRLSAEAEHQLQERADYFAAMDPGVLRDRLQAMYGFDRLYINSYGLFDRRGRPLAGHITALPAGLRMDGASHIYPLQTADGRTVSTRILAEQLPDGELLLLARDAGLIDQIHELILNAVLWGVSLTIVPGIAGGFLLSMRPLRRIRAIQDASERVIAGRLGQRLPEAGRGDELDMLARIVNRMLERIEQLMLEVKSVCDNIAHDLRTPLTHLRASLHRLQQQAPADGPLQQPIQRAIAETDELMARFAALLRVSELRDEHRRSAFAEVDLAEALAQVHDLYEPLAEEKALELRQELGPLRPVLGDRQLLIEAFSNLVANAIKFTPSGGRVLVRAAQEREGPRVDVIDSGPGIDPQHRARIFDRFYRADPGRPTPGLGLGLSIVEAIVRLHGFQVEAGESTAGACLTVRCWPAADRTA